MEQYLFSANELVECTPFIRKLWNQRIAADETMEYPDYIFSKYLSDNKDIVILSPGCGTGEKELRWAGFPMVKEIVGIDLSPKRIALAGKHAVKSGHGTIHFEIADMNAYFMENDKFSIVIFDKALHDCKDVGFVLDRIKCALKRDGLLIINEYVGPNRFQWPAKQLEIANFELRKLPIKFRRRWNDYGLKNKIYKPGIIRMILSDPSEAVRSESILSCIHSRFKIIEEKHIGGDIISLVLKDIAHNFIKDTEEVRTILNELLDVENEFISNRGKSDNVFGIYKKIPL